MSRADAYAAFYRESRARLLLQVYAYCGDTEVAQRALADAYVSAGHHWRKLSGEADKDAWMRERAFRATRKGLNRSHKPWYVRALRTAEEHRPLLAALQALPAKDRELVVLYHLVGLDLPTAGREAGVTDEAAQRTLASAATALAGNGCDGTPQGIRAALTDLGRDLSDEPIDRASRLRREGNRRRRSHQGLVALCSLALVIGAGALTAAHPEQVASEQPTSPSQTSTTPAPESPSAADQIGASDLTSLTAVRKLSHSDPWELGKTSDDFGASAPYDECLKAVPSDRKAAHFFVRTFHSGSGPRPVTATQSLEVSRSIEAADGNYERLVKSFSACAAPNHQITGYRTVRGVGDASSIVALKYVDSQGVHDELVGISQSGIATSVWVIDTPHGEAASSRQLTSLMASSVQSVCGISMGGCSRRPFIVVGQVPPKVDRAKGFLTAIDLPVFPGLTEPWVGTSPSTVKTNPAATQCDQADFAGAGAKDLAARSFVVPSARTLATTFGMTETRGVFASVNDADTFIAHVSQNIRRCHDRQLSLAASAPQSVSMVAGSGRVWTIRLSMSQSKRLTFRVALFQVGTTVGQVTFTPTDRYDLSPSEFASLVRRAALRATQS